jgi:hypothetical protein
VFHLDLLRLSLLVSINFFAACAIFQQPKVFLDSDMPRAKRAKDAKFRKSIIFFAPLASFARDIPNFGCGYAALCRPNTFCGSFRFNFTPIRCIAGFEKVRLVRVAPSNSPGATRARRGIAARYIKANSSRKVRVPFFQPVDRA